MPPFHKTTVAIKSILDKEWRIVEITGEINGLLAHPK